MDNENGCQYCGIKGRDLKLLDGEGEQVAAFPLRQVFIKDEQIFILMGSGNKFIDSGFCLNCGRNLKTGNQMIELKPLKFVKFENIEFTEIRNFIFNSMYFSASEKYKEIYIHYSMNREIIRKEFKYAAKATT